MEAKCLRFFIKTPRSGIVVPHRLFLIVSVMAIRDQVQQIEKTREANFRLLRLLSLYINERPDFITPEMIREIAGIGGFGPEDAFLLLLAESCGIHPTDSDEDTRFFQEWLAPAVRCLDPEKYRSDPYYRTICFPDVRDGNWELRNDTYPPYRAFIWDDTHTDQTLKELPQLGYFSESFSYPAVLEDGREWMLVTPNEIETVRPAVNAARGRTVTFGLGLGYFPYMAAEKPDVRQVTVVEKDPAVIRLFRQYILPQFPHPEKIEVIHADAFEYIEKDMPNEHFDFAYADIWHDAGDGIPFYLRFNKYEARFPETEFQYWIEESMLSYLRWYDFDHMPADVRDPYRWLNNANVRRRALTLPADQWLAWRDGLE